MVYFLLIRENESAVFFWLLRLFFTNWKFIHKFLLQLSSRPRSQCTGSRRVLWFIIGSSLRGHSVRGRLHQSAVVQGRGAGEEHRVQYGVFLSDRPVVFSLKCKVMSSLKGNINGVTQESLILCKFVCYSLGRQVEEKDWTAAAMLPKQARGT